MPNSSESEEGFISDSDKGSMHSDRERPTTPPERIARVRSDIKPSANLSRFYRERFGSHSPEDYLNLRFSGFDKDLTKEEIRQILEDELRKMSPFEIKICRNPDDNECLAYVNFHKSSCAKTIRRTMIPRLQKQLGMSLMLDPTGVLRDQEGKYIPDRFNRSQLGNDRERRHSPPSYHRHSTSSGHNHNQRNLNQDDAQATRTLFVGNLPGDIRHHELDYTFGKFGDIEDIDIKLVSDGVAAFAFVVYQSVDCAIKALKAHHGRPVRSGSSTKCQIGYGRSQPSTRLWIGGLGSWTSKDLLMREFDRFGNVEQLEYTYGDPHAYVKYSSMNAASEACNALRNFPLDRNHRISVDFAKDKKTDKHDRDRDSRKRSRSSRSPDWNSNGGRKRRRSDSVHSNSRREIIAHSPVDVENLGQLQENIACTWKGFVTLKKTEYQFCLHRIWGREHLIQEALRDEDGVSLKLKLDQRVAREEAFYERNINSDPKTMALAVAVEGKNEFNPLIEYLNEKKAIELSFSSVMVHSTTTPNKNAAKPLRRKRAAEPRPHPSHCLNKRFWDEVRAGRMPKPDVTQTTETVNTTRRTSAPILRTTPSNPLILPPPLFPPPLMALLPHPPLCVPPFVPWPQPSSSSSLPSVPPSTNSDDDVEAIANRLVTNTNRSFQFIPIPVPFPIPIPLTSEFVLKHFSRA